MGSLSIWHWLVVLAVVVLIFGTKKLKNVGTDLGQAIRGFKSAMNEGEQQANDTSAQSQAKPKLSEQAAAPEAKQPAQNERQS